MTDSQEQNIPMVRLLDAKGEGVWVASNQITAIALAKEGMSNGDGSETEEPVSKMALSQGTIVEIQGTPDEIMQYLVGANDDDSGTLKTDTSPHTIE